METVGALQKWQLRCVANDGDTRIQGMISTLTFPTRPSSLIYRDCRQHGRLIPME